MLPITTSLSQDASNINIINPVSPTNFFMPILVGKWIVFLKCIDKNKKFKALNADGVDTPARLNNAEICNYDSSLLDKSISS